MAEHDEMDQNIPEVYKTALEAVHYTEENQSFIRKEAGAIRVYPKDWEEIKAALSKVSGVKLDPFRLQDQFPGLAKALAITPETVPKVDSTQGDSRQGWTPPALGGYRPNPPVEPAPIRRDQREKVPIAEGFYKVTVSEVSFDMGDPHKEKLRYRRKNPFAWFLSLFSHNRCAVCGRAYIFCGNSILQINNRGGFVCGECEALNPAVFSLGAAGDTYTHNKTLHWITSRLESCGLCPIYRACTSIHRDTTGASQTWGRSQCYRELSRVILGGSSHE